MSWYGKHLAPCIAITIISCHTCLRILKHYMHPDRPKLIGNTQKESKFSEMERAEKEREKDRETERERRKKGV